MRVIAESDYTLGLPADAPRFIDTLDPIFQKFRETIPGESQIEKRAGYHKVIATQKNFKSAYIKHDVPVVVPDNPLFDDVIDRVSDYFSFMHSEIEDIQDEKHDINLATAAGLPFSKLGYKKKLHAFTDGADVLEDLCSRFDHIAIDSDASKIELLSEEELKNNKLRDIKVSYLPHLMAQKILYDRQNALMIANHANMWIKYGVVKQYGGFHRMIKPLEKFMMRMESDGRKWDKTIYLMPTYKVRHRNLKVHPRLKELHDWCMYFVKNPYVLLPNGQVVRLKTGNMSGRNNTTPDNCVAHFIIRIYLYAKMLLRAYPDENWSFSTIFAKAVECIYSDDKIGAFDCEFYKITREEYIELEKETYAEFGIEIKPSSFLLTMGPGRIDPKHSFLGSYCEYDEFSQRYIPSPRFDKVCASLVLEPLNKIENPIDYYQRVLNLVILSYPDEKVFEEGVQYLKFLYDYPKFIPHRWRMNEILNLNNIDVDSRDSFYKLYLGYEGKIETGSKIFQGTSYYGRKEDLKEVPKKMAASDKHQNLLNLATKKGILTSGGLQWLVLATDPWHDVPADYRGMPDQVVAKSVAFSVVQEFNFSKPASLAAGNWALRVGNLPFVTETQVVSSKWRGTQIQQDAVPTTVLVGGVNCVAAADGTDFAYSNVVGTYKNLILPDSYCKGNVRVVGGGVEVVNTTSALHKQGLVTLATMAQPDNEPYTAQLGIVNDIITSSFYPVRDLPKNLSEMVLYPDNKQWEAKEGVYMPFKVKPFKTTGMPDPTQPLILVDDFRSDCLSLLGTCWSNKLVPNTMPGSTNSFISPECFPVRFNADSSVAMFTGLSEETTLTIRVRWLVERFPSDDEADILPMAKISARFDPMALEIYSRWVSRAPAGCKFTENPSGEWWKKTLGSLASIVGPLVSSIPHPIAKTIGGAISVGAPMLLTSAEDDRIARKTRNAQRATKGKAHIDKYGEKKVNRKKRNGNDEKHPKFIGPKRNGG